MSKVHTTVRLNDLLQRLMPRVLGGSSAGSLVCGMIGTRTDEECMNDLFEVKGTDAPGTIIDNGIRCVVKRASEIGLTGNDAPVEQELDAVLLRSREAIQLAAGPLMNLGDLSHKSFAEATINSPARSGGAISSQIHIPHHGHKTIGVSCAISVATAYLIEGPLGNDLARGKDSVERHLSATRPTGEITVLATLDYDGKVSSATF